MSRIDPATHMGAVHLTVADLERSLAYYRTAIGLEVLGESAGEARLGTASTELLHLTESPGASPADGHTGLFHFALLLPERTELARWLTHAAQAGVQLTGASDHFVSEALYLRDPDHHGIEIYWDRPRELWEGQVARMGSWPLDLDDIVATLEGHDEATFDSLPDGTTMGHVHLRVADVEETIAFYRDVLGFDLMAQLGPQAAFLSAGGYHHHLGGNTWESRGAGPAPSGSATLQQFTIVIPDESERAAVAERLGGGERFRDPSDNAFVLAAQPL
ncbi:MAG: VOC family protein [Actinobacteria bacterium]|nr:VOC family protein [Actinomycetota bacterium]